MVEATPAADKAHDVEPTPNPPHLQPTLPDDGGPTTTNAVEANETCVHCLEPAKRRCTGCKDVKYCTKKCQKADWPVHKLLCKVFQTRGAPNKRPTPQHVRAILFPKAAENPTFVWIGEKASSDRNYAEFANGANFTGGSEFQNLNGTSRCAATQQLWFMFDIGYPKKESNLNQAILRLGPPGLGHPWCGPVLACGPGDVNMRDFRAVVDWFALHSFNKALLDPYRFTGPTVQGVRINTSSTMKKYGLPQLELIHMTPIMAKKTSRMELTVLASLLELPIAWHVSNDFPGTEDPNKTPDENAATYIITASLQMEALRKARAADADDPGKVFGNYGTVLISRLDNKPVHLLHVEAWNEFMFYYTRDTEWTTARKPLEAISKKVNKANFLEFWPKFLRRHQLVQMELYEVPNPYEV